jgi:phosphate butyryltransferase
MTATPIRSATELIARAVAIANEGRQKRVVVAAAQNADVMHAVSQAQAEGFLTATLVGDAEIIGEIAETENIDLTNIEVVDKPDVNEAAHYAAGLAAQRQAHAIMKGFLPTSALLKTLLDKQYNLRGASTLSHCAVLDIPGYHKLLNFTDGGMIVKPDIQEKIAILENAVMVGHALNLSPVKIAVSGAGDRVSPSFPHTLSDDQTVKPEANRRMTDIAIQGPMSFDLATSQAAAEYKHESGAVVGDADIYLVDSIEEGNIVSKALIQFAKAIFAGVIVGARVPVSLVSRTDTAMNKKASLALACVIADYYEQHNIWEDK